MPLRDVVLNHPLEPLSRQQTCLRKASNCTGYRSEWEREKFFGVCIDPRGITFKNSGERMA